MSISALPAASSLATSGLAAMASAFSGRPSPRSQSAITGSGLWSPDIRRAARSSASASAYRPVRYAASPAASRTAATRPARSGPPPRARRPPRGPRRAAGRPSPGAG